MALQKTFTNPDGSTQSYHRIIEIQAPHFKRDYGWIPNTGYIVIESYVSDATRQSGSSPVPGNKVYVISATAFSGMNVTTQDALLQFAYKNFKSFLTADTNLGGTFNLTDAIDVDETPTAGVADGSVQ